MQRSRDRTAIVFACLITLAILVRAPQYGNPHIHLDEEFYLLVGDRMLHGALPYVDIWDRKPIGLFLIYAFARMLGGDGIVPYQILASIAAGATAASIFLVARRMTGAFGAGTAAVAYLFWLLVYSGQGGQSPVFYNALTAGAAWFAFRANGEERPAAVLRLGIAAMALCGLILQIKYTAAPEGAFLGCWFLWRLRSAGMGVARLAMSACVFLAAGIAPTLLATIYYAWAGHLREFAFANFTSIFLRGPLSPGYLAHLQTYILITAMPLLLCAAFGLASLWTGGSTIRARRDAHLLTGWLLAATLGFVMIGNFYDHYFLPMLPPLLIAASVMMGISPIRIAVSALLVLWPASFAGFPAVRRNQQERLAVTKLAAAAAPHLHGRCLFVFDGPASLYLLTRSCLPSRFVYPDHFSNAVEAHALGIDIARETARVLGARPGAIVTSSSFVIPQPNPQTLALVRAAIARDYRLAAAVKAPDRTFYVWALRERQPASVTLP